MDNTESINTRDFLLIRLFASSGSALVVCIQRADWDRPDSLERGATDPTPTKLVVSEPNDPCQWRNRLRVAVSDISAVPHSPSTIDEKTGVTV
jgi:hypothetical protein